MSYTVTPIVDTDGNISQSLILGDDYNYANNRGLVWSIDPITGYSLGNCTCFLGLHFKGDTTLIQGTMALVSSKWELRFDIGKAATDGLDPGWYQYSVEVRHQDKEYTRVLSDCTVQFKRKWTDVTTTGETIDGGFPDTVYSTGGDSYDGGSP